MIPIWLLTILHYASVMAAVAVIGLLGWHYLWPRRKRVSGTKERL